MKFQEFRENKGISPQRKALYYGGMALTAVGLLLFLSVFFSAATSFGNFPASGMGSGFMTRSVAGIILVVAGGFVRGIGARGLASSGVVLDPEKAREDLSPYTGAMGAMARDAVDAFRKAGVDTDSEGPQVMVRCRACKALNREDAKYCDKCGEAL